jgi:hypothetical protein
MRAALLFFAASAFLRAQMFDAASVKVNKSGSPASSTPNLYQGRLRYTNATTRQMLQIAWASPRLK